MRALAILLSMVALSAAADQEFHRGDVYYYQQPSPPKKQPAGVITFPAGTYQRLAAGDLGPLALRITATEAQILLGRETETLSGEKRQGLLTGEMITLASGRRVQFFRPVGKAPHVLVVYSATGGLQEIIHLIEKKT
jgi:hypothetical protein